MTGRILCLDVGNVRIGIAVSDPTGLIAQPIGTYTRVRRDDDIEHIAELALKYDAAMLLSGLPLLEDGTEGEQAKKTRSFVAWLSRKTGLPAVFSDERYSTVEAGEDQRLMGIALKDRKKTIDTIAAMVILQNYLDGLK